MTSPLPSGGRFFDDEDAPKSNDANAVRGLGEMQGSTPVRTCLAGNAVARAGDGDYSVLATACVSPPSARNLVRTDPRVRLNDYAIGLATWMDIPDPRIGNIVVLENSGFDPEVLAETVMRQTSRGHRRLEVISYLGPARPPGTHYGYSEFEMIDDLIDESTLLGCQFIKSTGRYAYPRIPKLLDEAPDDLRFMIDSKNHPAVPWLGRLSNQSSRTDLFLARRDFYDRYVRKLYREVRQAPGYYKMENILFTKLSKEHAKNGVYLRFPINCNASGMGGNGDALDTAGKRIKSAAKGVLRKLLPKVWI